MIEWQTFDKEFIHGFHGNMERYRDLYKGNHSKYFSRAEELIKRGEIVDNLRYGEHMGKNITTPYIIMNVCKMIIDTPTLFVTRSIGPVKTNYPVIEEQIDEMNDDGEELIEGTKDNTYNSEVLDPQQEIINQITENSKINHRKNLTQLQVDGGIVAIPKILNGKLMIDIKERNTFYPHDDKLGYDLVFELPQSQEEKDLGIDYVHVYREREEENQVTVKHMLYQRNSKNSLELVEDVQQTKEKLGIEKLEQVFSGRKRSFVNYLPYNPTFIDEYGVSALEGLEGRQDEVNWSLTRTAQTFERNGKPRISVTAETMETLKSMAQEHYGDENKIDHEWLEVQEINDSGQTMQIHQIDTQKIGDMNYVKDIVRAMLSETQTSESAFDFTRRDTSSAQSGVAKFYDLMLSLMKSESILDEYTEWMKTNYENALWLANKMDNSYIIEKPNIMRKSMLPQPSKELADENIAKYSNGIQSLDETVKKINPDKSDEWIVEELQRILDSKSTLDSTTLSTGNTTLLDFMNNRDSNGTPLNEDGTPVNVNEQEE